MQITVSNPLAAHSLWTTLASLADRVVEGCVCGQVGVFPYTLTLFKGDITEHLTINASNASYRVSKLIDIEKGVTTYQAQKQGYVGDVIKETLRWYKHTAEMDAVKFLSGLIEFVQTYTTPDGAKIREELAKAEAKSIQSNVSRIVFYQTIEALQDKPLDLREFYSQKDSMTDIAQIVTNRLPNSLNGIYTYTSLSGVGRPDTLVVKAESGHVATVSIVDGKYVMMSSCKKLMDLVDLTGGISGQFVTSLVDKTSFVYGVLNTVDVE